MESSATSDERRKRQNQSADVEGDADGPESGATPKYGTQEYWEERYRKRPPKSRKVNGEVDEETQRDEEKASDDADKVDDGEDQEPEPDHAWYFSYSDLEPILLPLIFGDDDDEEEQEVEMIEEEEGDEATADQNEDGKDDGKGEGRSKEEGQPKEEEGSGRCAGTEKSSDGTIRKKEEGYRDEEEADAGNVGGDCAGDVSSCGATGTDHKHDHGHQHEHKHDHDHSHNNSHEHDQDHDNKHDDDDNHDHNHDHDHADDDNDNDVEEEEEGEEVEIEEIEVEGDDEGPPTREGLCKNGPVSVIEIGCGDVPLGRDLVQSVRSHLSATKSSAALKDILETVVCTDYSDAVIQQMNEEQAPSSSSDDPLQYVTADCRKLTKYADCTFDLILEKGTLDAMLSNDSEDAGVQNCREIMAECSRLLKPGGVMLVVSHLNAHVQKGLDWLERVVLPGLRRKIGKNATESTGSFEIEVHGNGPDEASEEEEEPEVGPGVYIIHKHKTEDTDEEKATIPLKFFSY